MILSTQKCTPTFEWTSLAKSLAEPDDFLGLASYERKTRLRGFFVFKRRLRYLREQYCATRCLARFEVGLRFAGVFQGAALVDFDFHLAAGDRFEQVGGHVFDPVAPRGVGVDGGALHV